MGFWSGRSVAVTGGSGFLGSFVVERLRGLGCRNVIVPRSREYDLTSNDAVKRFYRDTRPEIVIHLAARVGGIEANRRNPGLFFYENLMMGAQVIEQARHNAVEKLTIAGTICAYPKLTPVPFCESNLWSGYPEETNAPYGIAKKALLVQAQAYRQQYGLNSIYLLPVNLYGPRDNFDLEMSHVIPALIRKFLEATQTNQASVEVWGTGTATREFLYVDDCAEALLLATERYNGSDPVNVGSGREVAIRDLVTMIADLCQFRGDVVWNSSKPDGQPRRSLDVSRAKDAFGFVARTSLEDGLRATLEWYQRAMADVR